MLRIRLEIVATIRDPSAFASGREFSAFIGLTPRQTSSGGKERLGRITKMGDRTLRKLLVVGACSVLNHRKGHNDALRVWADRLLARKAVKYKFKLTAAAIARTGLKVAIERNGLFGTPEARLALAALRRASEIRNVLCHGSWRSPDADGKSLPLFVNRRQEVFCTPIDVEYLRQTQRAVAELIGNVVSSITVMGWQFPGTRGPGAVIYQRNSSNDASDNDGSD